ncbi:hypothetical protein BDZ91DRAFT_730654 [Kalaharituber pfeilii]|nr:hypothetical protein BDZ91DRAFT_730654 [Kalaharituber pfeilii]
MRLRKRGMYCQLAGVGGLRSQGGGGLHVEWLMHVLKRAESADMIGVMMYTLGVVILEHMWWQQKTSEFYCHVHGFHASVRGPTQAPLRATYINKLGL